MQKINTSSLTIHTFEDGDRLFDVHCSDGIVLKVVVSRVTYQEDIYDCEGMRLV